MALAILFAQTTGEGMGVWDWAGSEEFRDTCARFVLERTAPDWPGLERRASLATPKRNPLRSCLPPNGRKPHGRQLAGIGRIVSPAATGRTAGPPPG